MSLPKIGLIHNSISDTAIFSINGKQCGEIWMTERGCCHKHTNRDFVLSTDHVEIIVVMMRSAEVLGMDGGNAT